MSGGVGWRKRIHSRPGAAKLNQEDRALPDTDTDSLRPPSERSNWRNTFHSRPGTPSRAPTPTIFHVDTDDVRRDITLDVPNPRKATKPKLARYLSGYLAVKDVSKEPEFSVPWLEIPPASREYVDPMASLQSVFSHMTTNPSCPIPLHYNNGIFRVFEDYRKVRDEKERLDDLLHETFEGYRAVERFFEKAEAEYQAEIRRLELLIARGTSGMDGVIKARRDSTVRRMIAHKKTASEDSALVSLENTPTAQLDDQIRIRSQQGMYTLSNLVTSRTFTLRVARWSGTNEVFPLSTDQLTFITGLLHRPVSPSSKMAMLSRRLENTQSTSDFIVGTPPIQERKVTLSRKLQSELDLARLADPGINGSVPRSVDSGFSGNGDPLPDEVDPQLTMVGPAIDLEAFVALKELGSLVARKRGIDTNRFLTGLMQLFSMGSEHGQYELRHGGFDEEINTSSFDAVNNPVEAPTTPEHIVRHVRSQPLLWSAQRSRRHFSFEPSQNSVSHNADTQKPPRIPSPMQWPGLKTVRRGSSNSSIRTTLQNPDTRERRSSRSSVLTAFRQESNGSSRPVAQSRSSSVNALRHVEAYSSGSAGGLGARCNFATVAAVRAVEQADNLVSKTIAAQSASIAPASGSSA